MVVRAAARLRHGHLTLCDATEALQFAGEAAGDDVPAVTVQVHDPAFYRAILAGGVLGAGEAYMAGHWSTSDLAGLMRLLLQNLSVYEGLESGIARFLGPARRLENFLRRNTLSGSRRNIHAHYDLGNEFFKLFLDETMAYSSAIFERPDATLAEASVAKMDRLCQRLQLRPADHLVEIGTGWGGLALHAAKQYGCRVTTTTISQEQHRLARQRVADAGLSDRVTVLLRDYRLLEGRYDKLVSVEMIEAVGHQYFDTFFAKCAALLKPDGMMALQAITITDQYFPTYLRGTDFIRKYIFPGGCLTSLRALAQSAGKVSPLRLVHQEDFGLHYAETLRRWRAAFLQQLDTVRAQGYSDSFLRMWEFYLCLCEAGFEEREIGVSQLVYCMPGARPGTWYEQHYDKKGTHACA
jgi:cyclopropane-fatty-acyl-phospholipid synthase